MSSRPTKIYKLRPLEKSDLEVVSPWFQDVEDLARFDRTSRAPLNLLQIEENWSDIVGGGAGKCNCWFAVESDIGDVVGLGGLDSISSINRDAVIAMFTEKSVRRSGVGIRATAMVIDFAFRQLGLNRLTSYYRADNLSSRDLVSKVGFEVEGLMRQAWFADGQFRDMIVVGLLKNDWFARREQLAREMDGGTTVTIGPGLSASWSWPPLDEES